MALAGPARRPKVTANAPSRPTSRAPAPRRFDRHALIDTLKILRQLGSRPVSSPPAEDPAALTNGRTRAARGGHDAPNHTMKFARDDLSETAPPAPGAASRSREVTRWRTAAATSSAGRRAP